MHRTTTTLWAQFLWTCPKVVAKMNAYRLNGDACEFMFSYLTGRFQRVTISDERSSCLPLLKGIPQGSSLGPFIFNVFMNDIFYFIETCDLTNYADDNTLLMTIPCII